MNKKGFTLVELLATIVIIGLIMTLVMPSASRVSNDNKERMYKEYEKMMIEYAKINRYNEMSVINLYDLDELDNVKEECEGYVTINHSANPATYASYISCGENYTTTGYDSSVSNSYNTFCQGCVFPILVREEFEESKADINDSVSNMNTTGNIKVQNLTLRPNHYSLLYIYTTWNTQGKTPTVLDKKSYTRNYKDVVYSNVPETSGFIHTDAFVGVILNSSNQIERAFACALVAGSDPYCIEGTSSGSKNNSNKTILQTIYNRAGFSCSASSNNLTCYNTEANNSLGGNLGTVATTFSSGGVYTGDNGNNMCYVKSDGTVYCDDTGIVVH